jgi:hypothetical protein
MALNDCATLHKGCRILDMVPGPRTAGLPAEDHVTLSLLHSVLAFFFGKWRGIGVLGPEAPRTKLMVHRCL